MEIIAKLTIGNCRATARTLLTPAPMETVAPPSPPEPPSSSWPKTTVWILGIVAGLGLLTTSILSVGLAAVLCAPLLVLLAGVGWSIWAARRRRQILENRSEDEIRDAAHATRQWPVEGVVDDRLPEP
jgi:hypothetical protein